LNPLQAELFALFSHFVTKLVFDDVVDDPNQYGLHGDAPY